MQSLRYLRTPRSKFASSLCKNVSRKGAKEQRERNSLGRYLGSFAPLREIFGCGAAALRLCVYFLPRKSG
jgi:hypothetical protein